jgi:hypothetical protein
MCSLQAISQGIYQLPLEEAAAEVEWYNPVMNNVAELINVSDEAVDLGDSAQETAPKKLFETG